MWVQCDDFVRTFHRRAVEGTTHFHFIWELETVFTIRMECKARVDDLIFTKCKSMVCKSRVLDEKLEGNATKYKCHFMVMGFEFSLAWKNWCKVWSGLSFQSRCLGRRGDDVENLWKWQPCVNQKHDQYSYTGTAQAYFERTWAQGDVHSSFYMSLFPNPFKNSDRLWREA